MLTAAVTQEREEVYYYQGLHDIAAVLLFVVGQELAAEALAKLCTAHLRDYTRSNFVLIISRPHRRELHRAGQAGFLGYFYIFFKASCLPCPSLKCLPNWRAKGIMGVCVVWEVLHVMDAHLWHSSGLITKAV